MVNKIRTRGACVLSVVALGLAMAPAAHASDLAVLTATDICDTQGLRGLTLSSSDNCLKISGEAKYTFKWGDYNQTNRPVGGHRYSNGENVYLGNGVSDWESAATFKLTAEGSSASDFGAARGVITLKGTDEGLVTNAAAPRSKNEVVIDEAYLAVGDKTVLMVGKKGTIAETGNDTSFTFQALFQQGRASGVGYNSQIATNTNIGVGGHVIQVKSDLGNGLTVGAALEKLDDDGTLIGVVLYKSDMIDGHLTVLADEVLRGHVNDWAVHAGFTAKLDKFRVRGAFAANNDGWWNVLGTADAKLDIYTLAIGAEATSEEEFGIAGSITADFNPVKINVGSRAFWEHNDVLTVDTAFQAEFKVAEAITLTAGAGYIYESDKVDGITYGTAKLAWKPSGGYESEVSGRVNSKPGSDLGYQLQYTATKKF
jgi:hypothetical protein